MLILGNKRSRDMAAGSAAEFMKPFTKVMLFSLPGSYLAQRERSWPWQAVWHQSRCRLIWVSDVGHVCSFPGVLRGWAWERPHSRCILVAPLKYSEAPKCLPTVLLPDLFLRELFSWVRLGKGWANFSSKGAGNKYFRFWGPSGPGSNYSVQ